MSFHRVLPRPSALSNQDLARRWALEPDALHSARIMTDERPSTATDQPRQLSPHSDHIPEIPAEDHPRNSPSQESLDDYQSPKPSIADPALISKGVASSSRSVDTWQGDSPSDICLCQPDPKVPRPRNAFILYRQHHQASVVSQNPGLANPEISKVIGDHWRSSPEEVKSHWKALAEEEKLRHQKQYPDYRYQPRRSVKQDSFSNNLPNNRSADTEPRKCAKCGGKSMGSVNMPSGTGFANQNPPNTPFSPKHAVPTPGSATNAGRFMRSLASPPVSNPKPGYRYQASGSYNTPLPLHSPRYKRPDNNEISPLSPDSKRRRLTNVAYAPSRAPNGPQSPFPFPQGHQRRQSLPRPDFMGPAPSPFSMGPPPRVPGPQPLTLAPLKLSQSKDREGLDSSQAKSLEAMILSIPTLNKIKVLAKISGPPTIPASTQSANQSRGLIIAIDAADPSSLKQLAQSLKSNLAQYDIRVFDTPQLPPNLRPDYQAYLGLIKEYHALSAQILAYITPSHNSPTPVSPKSFPMDIGTEIESRGESKIPIAILPAWQLTHTDAFACDVEISDRYSPVDHWQWGATVWRGVVGADVTIAVKADLGEENPTKSEAPARPGEHDKRKPMPGSSGAAGSGGGNGGVEIRLEDARAVIVKGEKEGGVAEGSLRRVGFEIGEWIRNWDEREKGSS